METQGNDNGKVERRDTRAIVEELLVPQVRKRLALAVHTRHVQVADTLEDEEGPVDSPCLCVREGTVVGQAEELLAKVGPRLAGRLALREATIVVGSADPHVPHENREANHHGSDSGAATKLVVRVCVHLRVGALEPAINDALLLLLGRAIGMPIGLDLASRGVDKGSSRAGD